MLHGKDAVIKNMANQKIRFSEMRTQKLVNKMFNQRFNPIGHWNPKCYIV